MEKLSLSYIPSIIVCDEYHGFGQANLDIVLSLI